MFIYFDSNGVLKEIISDGAFRNGDSARDKIYIYVEGEPYITSAWIKFRLPNGNETIESCFFDRTTPIPQVAKQLPLEPKRNLKFFDYNHTYVSGGVNHLGYMFYEIEVPSSVLNSSLDDDEETPTSNNMVIGRARFVYPDNSIMSLGAITFSVESNIGILTDNSINETQYNYLLSKTDIGNPVVYTPYFVGTELHFSNNAGLPNPTPVNLKGDRGVSIDGFTKISTVGLIDTYRISLDDGTYYDLEVKNGKEVTSIELTSQTTSIATYTVTYNDGSTSTFEVTNSMDEAARYNLGAFDIVMKVNGITTITRQTGYLKFDGSENWQGQTYGVYLVNALTTSEILSIKDNYGITWVDSWSQGDKLGYLAGNNPRTLNVQYGTQTSSVSTWKEYLSQHPLVIQYKLATSYYEQVIENQPLNTLDQAQSQIVREEVEKGLNLTNLNITTFPLNSTTRHLLAENLPKGTYTLTLNLNNYGSGSQFILYINDSAIGTFYNGQSATFTSTEDISSIKMYNNDNIATSSKVMLVKGTTIPTTYSPYNANKHITNAQAELLKDEFDRCSNEFDVDNNTYSNAYYNNNGVKTSSPTDSCIDNQIQVKSNTTYTLSFNANVRFIVVVLKNGNDVVSRIEKENSSYFTFTTPSNCNFLLFNVNKDLTNISANYITTISPMLNEGSTALPYKEYEGKIVHKKELNAVENKIVKLYAHDVRLKLSIVYNNFDFGDADTSFTYRVITRFATPFANIGSLITSASDGEILSISLLETENEDVLKAYPLSISLNDSDAGSWIVCMIDDTAKVLSIDKNFSFISDTVTLLA